MIENVIKQLAPKGYLRAAINLSNFLLVTGKESNGDPQGVSPDMAKALANELNVDIKLITFNRPGELADAISEDAWDIGNIANVIWNVAKRLSGMLPDGVSNSIVFINTFPRPPIQAFPSENAKL